MTCSVTLHVTDRIPVWTVWNIMHNTSSKHSSTKVKRWFSYKFGTMHFISLEITTPCSLRLLSVRWSSCSTSCWSLSTAAPFLVHGASSLLNAASQPKTGTFYSASFLAIWIQRSWEAHSADSTLTIVVNKGTCACGLIHVVKHRWWYEENHVSFFFWAVKQIK